MLNGVLIHPVISGALAAAGHGSTVLLTDGHYPASTAVGPNATVVHLNLTPGLVDVSAVLKVLLQVAPWEAAAAMIPPAGEGEPPAVTEYRSTLSGMAFATLDRFAFYDAAKSTDVALVIVTGDVRKYANLLLTIGVRHGAAP